MKRAILSAPGSRGDVNPMIAIGDALQRAGFDVVISLAEPYAEAAEARGLRVESVIDRERFTEILGHANVWKPVRGAISVMQHIAREFMPLHAAVIERHRVPGETVLVSHPLDLVSRSYRDADPSLRLVDVHPAPMILRTLDEPPRLSPWWFEPSKPAWVLRAGYALVDHAVFDPILRGPVNRIRASLDLPKVRRIMHQWWLSPDLILAMYPDWFAPGTKSWPNLVHCGFPLDDVDGSEFTMPEDQPIAFTFGTAHHHCRRLFELAVDACRQLDRPGLLLSTHPQNFPPNLPDRVRPMGYASLRRLLPSCSAIVHHGGIGTTSQSLAAGIPQVIRPFAFDQFDNATRVERLGCGRWLRRDADLAATLDSVLGSGRDAMATCAGRLHGSDAAARVVEEVASRL